MGAGASSTKTSSRQKEYNEIVSLKVSHLETQWKIRNFSYHCKNTKLMISTAFVSEDGELWRIMAIPNDNTLVGNGFFSVYLKDLNQTEFHCLTPQGEMTCKRGLFSYPYFKSTNYLLSELLDHKDVLVLSCKIKRVDRNARKYFIDFTVSRDYKLDVLEMTENFSELLNDSELSDADLLAADGKVFKVHKAVLAARSKVFRAMFRNKMLEHRTSIVKIEDFDGPVMEQVLKFIYTTKSEITDGIAKDVLLAADKYDIGGLKRECVDYLFNSLNIQNAIKLLEFAERYDVRDLKLEAQLFITKNAKDITQQPDFDLAVLDVAVVNQLFRQIAAVNKIK